MLGRYALATTSIGGYKVASNNAYNISVSVIQTSSYLNANSKLLARTSNIILASTPTATKKKTSSKVISTTNTQTRSIKIVKAFKRTISNTCTLITSFSKVRSFKKTFIIIPTSSPLVSNGNIRLSTLLFTNTPTINSTRKFGLSRLFSIVQTNVTSSNIKQTLYRIYSVVASNVVSLTTGKSFRKTNTFNTVGSSQIINTKLRYVELPSNINSITSSFKQLYSNRYVVSTAVLFSQINRTQNLFKSITNQVVGNVSTRLSNIVKQTLTATATTSQYIQSKITIIPINIVAVAVNMSWTLDGWFTDNTTNTNTVGNTNITKISSIDKTLRISSVSTFTLFNRYIRYKTVQFNSYTKSTLNKFQMNGRLFVVNSLTTASNSRIADRFRTLATTNAPVAIRNFVRFKSLIINQTTLQSVINKYVINRNVVKSIVQNVSVTYSQQLQRVISYTQSNSSVINRLFKYFRTIDTYDTLSVSIDQRQKNNYLLGFTSNVIASLHILKVKFFTISKVQSYFASIQQDIRLTLRSQSTNIVNKITDVSYSIPAIASSLAISSSINYLSQLVASYVDTYTSIGNMKSIYNQVTTNVNNSAAMIQIKSLVRTINVTGTTDRIISLKKALSERINVTIKPVVRYTQTKALTKTLVVISNAVVKFVSTLLPFITNSDRIVNVQADQRNVSIDSSERSLIVNSRENIVNVSSADRLVSIGS